jgi:hypothetical protein
MVPYGTYVGLFMGDNEVEWMSNDCSDITNCYQWVCFNINKKFDSVSVGYISGESAGVYDTTMLLQDYEACLNNPNHSEQYCAAYDTCLEENYYNTAMCPEDVIASYENPNWVSGGCGEQ